MAGAVMVYLVCWMELTNSVNYCASCMLDGTD